MRNIYTGIDFGSDSIKIVVAEEVNGKYYVLHSNSTKSAGVRRGVVSDYDDAVNSLKNALDEFYKTSGILIKKAIITIPSNDRRLQVVDGSIGIYKDKINGEDVISVLQEATINKIYSDEELVSIIPITFGLDGDRSVNNPNGLSSSVLKVKALLATAPKENIYPFLKIMEECSVEVVDITFNSIGDFCECSNPDMSDNIGAIINIGHDKTDISVFNKGIIIKNSIINLGSKNIDKDISYIFGTNLDNSREIKEKFAVSSLKYADSNEIMEIKNNDDKKVTINQVETSEVVEARVVELLKMVKSEFNILTKRKISYIIVIGGVSEMIGFGYLVENILGVNAYVYNVSTMGIRSNKYISAMGIIKYYHDKLMLREKNDCCFSEEDIFNFMKNKKYAK